RTSLGNDRLWFETWGMGALLVLPPGSDIGDGVEHTIAIVYDGGTTITVYFDGVAGAPATLYAPLDTVNGQVMLGQTLYGAVSAGAEMRHFAIYDSALAPSDIAAIHGAIEAGGSLSYTQGANGMVTRAGGQLTYTPAEGFAGTDSFTYTITDGKATASATVTVEVLPPLLEVVDDTAFTQQDTPVTVAVLDNDEGNNLSVASTSDGANGTVSTDGTTVTYTPDAGFWGTDSFTVTFVAGTESATSTVTVTVNGAPDGDDLTDSTEPETPVTISIVPPVTDPEGGELTITSAGPASNGTVTIDSGEVVYTPNEGFTGTDTFEVTVTDEDGGSVTISVTVVVHVALVAHNDSAFTQQDTPVTVPVLDNDEGDDLSVSGTGATANGTVTTDGTTITYTPDAGFFGTDTFTVTVQDAVGGAPNATSTVTVTVNGAPAGPDIDGGTTPSETPIAVTVIPPVTDPEGGELTITSAGPASNGTVTIDGDDVVYTPNPGATGPDTFEVTITDEDGGSVTITVSVNVNTPPTATDVALDTQQQVAVDYDTTSSVTDPDGDEVEIVAVSTPANGTVTSTGSTLTYTPNAGFSGTDSFTVTVEDEHGGSANFAVTVTVNGWPEGDDITTTTDEDIAVAIDVLAGITDPEGDDLAVANVTVPGNGTTTVAGGVVTYLPAAGFSGTDSFDVTVEDDNGGSVTITVTVTVEGAPRIVLAAGACVAVVAAGGDASYLSEFWLEAPGIPSFLGLTSATTVGEQTALGTFTAGTELVLSIHVTNTGHVFQSGPAANNPDGLVHVQLTPGTGNVLYTVGFEDLLNGGDADFNDALVDLVTIECDVEAMDDTAETTQDAAVDIAVLANDSSGHGDLALVSASTPANGTVSEHNGVLTYTPNAGFTGTDSFTYTVANGLGGTATATVTVEVAPAGMVLLSQAACIAVRVEPSGDVAYTNRFWLESPGTPDHLGIKHSDVGDVEFLGTYEAGTELVLSIHVQNTGHTFKTGPAYRNPDGLVHAVVTPGTGNVLYRVGFEDLYNGGDLDFDDAVLSVLAFDCGIDARDNSATVESGGRVDIDVLDNDESTPDGDMEVISVTQPANGSAEIEDDGAIEYRPDAGFQGTDTFTYTVRNEYGAAATATVTVTVESSVIARDDSATTRRGERVDIDVLDNDSTERGWLRVTSVTQPAHGEVEIEDDGEVEYRPDGGFSGTDTFTYTVSNGRGGSATATVTVTVESNGVTRGKMTGGGNYQTGSGGNKKIYNWAMEFRCSNGGGHFSFHDEDNRLHVNNVVITSMYCSDEPGYDNGKDFDTVAITGTAKSAQYGNSHIAVTIEGLLTDQSQNGKSDTITVTVRRASNGQVLSQLDNVKLKGGNHVAHDNN
ncbi:MAG: Ig-like domain-containing protein, partial [Dehalococcoidia bacterium]|nr:Ig-like domain-containing protein [Dehalococcoidia bacterium]